MIEYVYIIPVTRQEVKLYLKDDYSLYQFHKEVGNEKNTRG